MINETISTELGMGQLISDTFTHKLVNKLFPYEFNRRGKLIAVMALHIYMKENGDMKIVHDDDNGRRSIHIFIEFEDTDGDTYYIDQNGIHTSAQMMQLLYAKEKCSKIKIEPFSINSLRLSETPYYEDTEAFKAANKISIILKDVLGEWTGVVQ